MEKGATRDHFEFQNQEKLITLCSNKFLEFVIKKGL